MSDNRQYRQKPDLEETHTSKIPVYNQHNLKLHPRSKQRYEYTCSKLGNSQNRLNKKQNKHTTAYWKPLYTHIATKHGFKKIKIGYSTNPKDSHLAMDAAQKRKMEFFRKGHTYWTNDLHGFKMEKKILNDAVNATNGTLIFPNTAKYEFNVNDMCKKMKTLSSYQH